MVRDSKVVTPLRKGDIHHYSVKNWQKYFALVFNDTNRKTKAMKFSSDKKSYTRGHIISHITEDLGDLAEKIRESDSKGCKKYIGSMLAWICALCTEWDLDLETIIWDKFPGYCPYCCKGKDCTDAWWSLSQTKKNKKPKCKPSQIKNVNSKPTYLVNWIKMWDKVYGRKITIAIPISDIMYKLYEEQSEIIRALNKIKYNKIKTLAELKSEIPDFLSWIFALIIKLDKYYYITKEEVPFILYEKFKRGCAACKNPICTCPPLNR